MVDPTWFEDESVDLTAKLQAQLRAKPGKRLREATQAYIEFLSLGGRLRFKDLSLGVIEKHLERSMPIVTGLSATYLYHARRERSRDDVPDDVRGQPVGHYVVLCGLNRARRTVTVADPLLPNPLGEGQHHHVPLGRALGAVLLGALTYDASLLVIEPAAGA